MNRFLDTSAMFEPQQASHPSKGRQPWFQVRKVRRGAAPGDLGEVAIDFVPSMQQADLLANHLELGAA